MRTREQRAVSVGLLVLGVSGLCLAGFGATPGAPAWCWLVVLGLGVVAHVAVEDRAAKARVARRIRRELDDAAENVRLIERTHGGRLEEVDRRLTDFLALWGPAQQENRDEAIRRLNSAVGPLVEAHNKGKLTGHLQNVLGGKPS